MRQVSFGTWIPGLRKIRMECDKFLLPMCQSEDTVNIDKFDVKWIGHLKLPNEYL